MSDLVAFLVARLDEDEAAAKAAGGEWDARTLGGRLGPGVTPGHGVFVRGAQPTGRLATANTWPLADHMARHDPARALREVGAKRSVLRRHVPEVAAGARRQSCWHDGQYWPCADLMSLAAVYGDHPDYDPEWKP